MIESSGSRESCLYAFCCAKIKRLLFGRLKSNGTCILALHEF